MGDTLDGNTMMGAQASNDQYEKILNYIIKVASGKIEVKATKNGYNDFIPWKRGVSL